MKPRVLRLALGVALAAGAMSTASAKDTCVLF